jgi:acetaldehyde dehydrogenase/alcohol dehydrogenase
MKHPQTNMVIATGAGNVVRAAYSSGKPAIGVGAANVPALIDETAGAYASCAAGC